MRERSRIRRRGLVVVLSAALAAASAVSGGAQSKSGPAVQIEPEEFDFGGVKQDQRLRHEFEIRNIGTEPLEIQRIATSCGCTAAVPGDKVVAPGASTGLLVTLETRKYKGVIEKSVSVATNDPGRVTTIRVKAFVEVPE